MRPDLSVGARLIAGVDHKFKRRSYQSREDASILTSEEFQTCRLSIIILCWNDLKVIADCLQSVYATTHSNEFEVIVSDNGSTDGSVEFIRAKYPQVKVIENKRNLRFAKANNVGI